MAVQLLYSRDWGLAQCFSAGALWGIWPCLQAFLLVTLGKGILLVGRDQRVCEIAYNAQGSPKTRSYLSSHASSARIEPPPPHPTPQQLSASEEMAGYLACGLSALSKAVSLWVTVLSLQFLESCDEVILLEDGEICEKGTHKELMEERGRYAKLIHNLRGLQFKVTTRACGEWD